jgi:2-polyprenyl-3-methyl-5-hydroxy-6-metoxy-1,4-benzoquinol methylase
MSSAGWAARAERERLHFDEGDVWLRSHHVHQRFRHVFECANTVRGERLLETLLGALVPARRVLEIGCGDGLLSRKVADLGAAYVLGTDVSEAFLERARTHAEPGRLEFAAVDAHQPIAGNFDVIVGRSVLHHLQLRSALGSLYDETLRPGGSMVFVEPLGAGLLMRLWGLIPHGAHTADERPLSPRDLAWVRRRFPNLMLYGINYLSFPAGILSTFLWTSADNGLLRVCDRIDHWLDRHVSALRPRFRQGILVIAKPAI